MAALETMAISLVAGVAAMAVGARLEGINNRKDAEARRDFLRARMDAQTGVANGLGFITEVEDRLADGEPVTVLWIGLQEPDRIRSFYNADETEAVLRTIAARLRETVGEADLVARWEDTTFAVVTGEARPDVLGTLLHDIREEIAAPQEVGGSWLNTWAWAGAVVCDPAWSFDQLLLRAVAAGHAAETGDGIALWVEPADDTDDTATALPQLVGVAA